MCDIILNGIRGRQKAIRRNMVLVTFEQASTIFLDPRMISVFDTKHSEQEDRWATIGIDNNGIWL